MLKPNTITINLKTTKPRTNIRSTTTKIICSCTKKPNSSNKTKKRITTTNRISTKTRDITSTKLKTKKTNQELLLTKELVIYFQSDKVTSSYHH